MTEAGDEGADRGAIAARVSLREITADSLNAVLKLSPREGQKRFVASNAVSIAQAMYAPEAWFRGIWFDDEPAGFVMLYDESLRDVPPVSPVVSVWRFMIDARFQGRGIGAAALDAIIEHVRGKRVSDRLLLSYVPGDGCPEPFYRRAGFVETGNVEEGEVEMALALHPR